MFAWCSCFSFEEYRCFCSLILEMTMGSCFKIFFTVGLLLSVATTGWAGEHPSSDSDCKSCHSVASSGDAPKSFRRKWVFLRKCFRHDIITGRKAGRDFSIVPKLVLFVGDCIGFFQNERSSDSISFRIAVLSSVAK